MPRITENTQKVMVEIGRYARSFRIHQGWSLEEVSKRSGVSLSNIAKFERGQSTSVNVLIAYIMLGMRAEYIQEVCQDVSLR